jgi:DNA polymerase III subunit gamma/tau
MFENILFQDDVVARLKSDLASGSLPPAMLFSGPEYAGKCTTALEVARALSCETGRAEWNCPCKACERHRLLLNTDAIFLGRRPFMQEIRASRATLERSRAQAGQYLYNRAVRKLLRRFDPMLWEGEEAKLAKVSAALQSIGEELEVVGPGSTLPEGEKLVKLLGSAEKHCAAIAELVPASIPINQVRRAAAWSYNTPVGKKRVVVVENADLMQESARNSLLKLLEEPPSSTVFILLTARRSALMPTILSRVRAYPFAARTEEGKDAVIGKIFRDEPVDFGSLRDYFLSFHTVSSEKLGEIARIFVDGLCSQAARTRRIPALLSARAVDYLNSPNAASDPLALIAADGKTIADAESFALFLEKLLEYCASLMRIPALDKDALVALTRWKKLIENARHDSDLLRMSPSLLTQELFYRMRSVLEGPK